MPDARCSQPLLDRPPHLTQNACWESTVATVGHVPSLAPISDGRQDRPIGVSS